MMCEELNEELRKGTRIATMLVDHLRDMGNAGAGIIPVLDRAQEYVVVVMPKSMFDKKYPDGNPFTT